MRHAGTAQPEGMKVQGHLSNVCKYLAVGVRRQRQASAPGAQDQKQQAQTETQEAPSEPCL